MADLVTPLNVLDDLTIDAVKSAVYSAHVKHGDHSILNPELPNETRLAVLVEEVGEVARALTYDNGDRVKLGRELLDVAAVALTWLEVVEKNG